MEDINKLLEEHKLHHYEYFEHESRIIYTYDGATSVQIDDFHRLILLLKEKNIKHEDIGLDVILIKKD